MTIHHDKLAYGKLEKTSEELTDEQILKMLAELGEDENGEPADPAREDEKEGKKEDK